MLSCTICSPGFKGIVDEPDPIGMKHIEYSLPYVLLVQDYRKYNIVNDTHPVATKYKECLSGEGANAGFRVKSIFIGEHAQSMIPSINRLLIPLLPQVTNEYRFKDRKSTRLNSSHLG